MPYTLYTAPYTGSLIAELALAQCGIVPKRIVVDYEDVAAGRSQELRKLNPLSRLPTLLLPNGEVLTESGAIVFHLAKKHPRSQLVQDTPMFYRLLFMLTGELYPTFTFADDPSEWVAHEPSREPYREKVIEFRKELWLTIDSLLSAKGPWALGRKFSAIDLYVTVMALWTPRETWVYKHCPRVARISKKVKALPKLKGHFPSQ